VILVLALAMAAMVAQEAAMERCAEAVVARLHPKIGMADMTGASFEWLQISGVALDLVIIGSFIEPHGKERVAHRFTCRTHGMKPPRVAIDKLIGR